MSAIKIELALSDLYEQWAGETPDLILPLAPSGSQRIYYRLQRGARTAIGAYNPNDAENAAFLAFSRHFRDKGLPVPEIYAEDAQRHVYLQEDLGSTTMYSFLLQKGDDFPDYLVQLYKRVVEQLARLQIEGSRDLDYSVCYPRESFDKQSMIWDFNTFKYGFLRLAYVPYDEQKLEDDFHRFADYLLGADCQYFMFRDFQTRNIMVKGGEPFFIDYQGGRRGALQYDLASLLYQAKADIPEKIKQELLDHYLKAVAQYIPVDREEFVAYYYGYVLMRCIQVFGTYGFRGLLERKAHFLQSIPFALQNVQWVLDHVQFPVEIPELTRTLRHLIQSQQFQPFNKQKGAASLLTVTINSFAYNQSGIPQDTSGNGGGFVFDCRFLHNPGRYESYKQLTGRDEPVINFLKHHSRMDEFLLSAFRIVDEAVEDYIERSFTNLMVNFGCTGGQHRSVYAADAMARHLAEKYGVKVEVHHIEQERKGWKN
ncbi:MAG: phosphotransferase [Saprospiraceae bacterium]|nr:phosphotransferase [Saprospiraceae bacterium]